MKWYALELGRTPMAMGGDELVWPYEKNRAAILRQPERYQVLLDVEGYFMIWRWKETVSTNWIVYIREDLLE